MTLSELIAGLQRFTQIAGDLPVIFKTVEGDVETVLHDIGININPTAGSATGSVTINHGAPAPALVPATVGPDGTSVPPVDVPPVN